MAKPQQYIPKGKQAMTQPEEVVVPVQGITQPEEVAKAEAALAAGQEGDVAVVIGADLASGPDTTTVVVGQIPPVDEVLSQAAGEQITATVEAVIQQPPAQVETAVQATVATTDSDVIDISKLSISVTSKIALQNIVDYINNMAPRKQVFPDDGARHQVGLYRAIMMIINGQEDDFTIAFNVLLKMFHDNRDGVFHEIRVFRFFETMLLPENDRRAFQRLLNLIKLTADPKGRELALKQINMNATLEHAVAEHGRNKLLSFFNV